MEGSRVERIVVLDKLRAMPTGVPRRMKVGSDFRRAKEDRNIIEKSFLVGFVEGERESRVVWQVARIG
jgi:hypothetical protein